MNAQIWNQIIPVIAVLAGGILGLFGNYFLMIKKFKHEQELSEREYLREQKEKKFRVYNRILEENVEIFLNALCFNDTDYRKYVDHVRPLLFENYHLLNKEIQEYVNELDVMVKTFNFLADASEQEQRSFIDHYYKNLCWRYRELEGKPQINILVY